MEILKLIPPIKSANECYKAGFDCALNGANNSNCHFSFFSTKEKMERWDDGKREGLSVKESMTYNAKLKRD